MVVVFGKLTLGAREYQLAPQRIGRISRKLGAIRRALGTGEAPSEITSTVYEALKVFIPELDPEWKLAGYGSAEAFDEVRRHRQAIDDALEKRIDEERQKFAGEHDAESWDDLPLEVKETFPGVIDWDEDEIEPDWVDPYDDAADTSPSFPEIADAIEAIFAVNGGKRLERLLANLVDPSMMKAIVRNEYIGWVSRRSQNARRPSGESRSTTSGTHRQTVLPAETTDESTTDSPSTDS